MDEHELEFLVTEQRKELMASKNFDADFDFAFRLQMQEAMAASLASQPSSSSIPASPPLMESDLAASLASQPSSSSIPASPPLMESDFSLNDDDGYRLRNLHDLELQRFEQERKDREQCEAEMRRLSEDLKRRVHDQKFAREILMIPEDDWEKYGNNIEKPFGECCSSSVVDEPFILYFKGLVSEETIGGSKVKLSGIGVAICDPRDNLILRVQKPLTGEGLNVMVADVKALNEGLNAALTLDIKSIVLYVDYYPLYQYIMGRWRIKQRKVATLFNQVFLLQRKFQGFRPVYVARNDVKFAFKLARDAIDSQIRRSIESSRGKNLNETCTICLEDTAIGQMFAVDGCVHHYCFTCMKQHVEVKLLHGLIPGCPHEGCNSKLNVDSCKKFLTPKLLEIMSQRILEASIPVNEKIYCPYPRCSALMSKTEVLGYSNNVFIGADRSGARMCTKCHGLFCINCKVPWHSNMTCNEYKRLNPYPHGADAELKSLATQKLWRQCVKCNHMIELAEGCFHMTCRCGYEFCYTCGAEWKNKKATCSCPLWDEVYIMYEGNREDSDEDEDFYDSDEYEDEPQYRYWR
ncbi:PREDICTED: uncharacterized protein LOC104594769 [Nelumbo nucifera]|uniref:RBR-type E3 ubiquitin transferase n=2 Tax=Nelumbo nucifera TaxID=4432 RepID=A0A822Y0V4_NELNU|nr:PREDICTED: uncharacterized protein LOC104594769 [Nelumbo nucifera]DAD26087.1 TPA_asm: hypothetical protein HUJ06_027555 [Nelumbo nucifera]